MLRPRGVVRATFYNSNLSRGGWRFLALAGYVIEKIDAKYFLLAKSRELRLLGPGGADNESGRGGAHEVKRITRDQGEDLAAAGL